MNYQKIYTDLILKSSTDDRIRNKHIYYEGHHIIPRCMGGPDDITNITLLTPREHFIAHLLLVKIHPLNNKLIYALNMMCVGNNRKQTNRTYGWIRELINVNNKPMLGRKHTDETKQKMSAAQSKENNHFFGKKHSDETKRKMKDAKKGKPGWSKGIEKSEDHRRKISETMKIKSASGDIINGMSGRKHTEESKKRMSETRKKNNIKEIPIISS
jgi:hypothetical protein